MPFELRPNAPPEGLSAERDGLRHSPRVEARLLQLAEKEGHPMMLPDLVPNTHEALALAEFAREKDPATHQAVHGAIFDAYFASGRDIGARDVLLEVAGSVGLDRDEVVRAWDERRYDDALHEYLHLGGHLGIDETPSALICDELLIGSRPYGVLRAAVDRCLAGKKEPPERSRTSGAPAG